MSLEEWDKPSNDILFAALQSMLFVVCALYIYIVLFYYIQFILLQNLAIYINDKSLLFGACM